MGQLILHSSIGFIATGGISSYTPPHGFFPPPRECVKDKNVLSLCEN